MNKNKQFKELRDITILANRKKKAQNRFNKMMIQRNKLGKKLQRMEEKMMQIYIEIEACSKLMEEKKDGKEE